MRTLVVVRHAKSAWPDGIPDLRRPLAERGRRDAPAAGRWLAAHLAPVDLAVVSPAVRARQTWELVSAELDPVPPSRIEERMYAEGPATILAVVRELPADARTVVLVGHNPDLEDLVRALTGEAVVFKTSTTAVLHAKGPWREAHPGWMSVRETATPRG